MHFKMPLIIAVHYFPLQIEETASTNLMHQVCLLAGLIHHKYCFPLCGRHLIRDATITL